MRRIIAALMVVGLFSATPLIAQQTTGNITGRVVDDQGAAVPGVTVTAKNAADRVLPRPRSATRKASTA